MAHPERDSSFEYVKGFLSSCWRSRLLWGAVGTGLAFGILRPILGDLQRLLIFKLSWFMKRPEYHHPHAKVLTGYC